MIVFDFAPKEIRQFCSKLNRIDQAIYKICPHVERFTRCIIPADLNWFVLPPSITVELFVGEYSAPGRTPREAMELVLAQARQLLKEWRAWAKENCS
jgi:hypothetical protein